MRRNILLGIVLLLAALTAFFVWKTKKDPASNFQRTDSNFKIEDINSIDRIIITQKDGTRSDLKRSGENWTINGNHRARKSTVDILLRGINRQHLDHIPGPAAVKNILPSINTSGIHVEIFDKSGNKLLGYYVGGVTQDERGTFFLKEGSTQVYSLEEPGFEGSLRVRYAIPPEEWRDVRFWVEENEKIDSLKIHYPKQRQHSFVIFKKGNDYGVRPLFTTTPVLEKENNVKIKSYLTTLNGLACEDYLDASPQKDSIIQMVPFMEMEMIYPDKTSHLRFFTSGEGGHTAPVFRYYMDYVGKDFMIGQHDVVKGAFRSYQYFFE